MIYLGVLRIVGGRISEMSGPYLIDDPTNLIYMLIIFDKEATT